MKRRFNVRELVVAVVLIIIALVFSCVGLLHGLYFGVDVIHSMMFLAGVGLFFLGCWYAVLSREPAGDSDPLHYEHTSPVVGKVEDVREEDGGIRFTVDVGASGLKIARRKRSGLVLAAAILSVLAAVMVAGYCAGLGLGGVNDTTQLGGVYLIGAMCACVGTLLFWIGHIAVRRGLVLTAAIFCTLAFLFCFGMGFFELLPMIFGYIGFARMGKLYIEQ